MQNLRLVGARLTPDRAFPAHGQGIYTSFLRDHLNGGRLFAVVANDGSTPLTVTGLEVNGAPIETLADKSLFDGAISGLNWWQAAPLTVAPGDLMSLRLRMLDLEALGTGPIRLTLNTDSGPKNIEIVAEQPTLWLPSVGFHANTAGDLVRAVIYVANAGDTAVTLPVQGGVRIDDQPVLGRPAQRQIDAGAVVPIEVDLRPFRPSGHWIVIEVQTVDGTSTIGSLRAFPASFSTSFWQLGHAPDLNDPSLDLYGIDRDHPASSVFVDEPLGARIGPAELSDRVQSSWSTEPNRPLMIQLTGYQENLLYGDIGDITMTHHRDVEQDLSLFLSWPKPIWYLPQNAWARNSQPGVPERWYPLEDLRHQAFAGIARGAKHIQWFTFWNLWNQGHGRGGAIDSGRTHQDISMNGAVSNPLLMDRVGRLSLVMRMLEPYLAVSAPAFRNTTPSGIEVTTLVSGTDRAVAVLIDKYTPLNYYLRSEPGATPTVLTDQTVLLQVPAYVEASNAFLIDPFEGVQPLPLERVDADRVRLQLTRFHTAALVVLGSAHDGHALEAAWQQLVFPNPKGALDQLRSWGEPLPHDWAFRDFRLRLPMTIANDGVGSRSIFDVLIDWPDGVQVDSTSMKLVDIDEGQVRPVLALASGPQTIVDYALQPNDKLEMISNDRYSDLFTLTRSPIGLLHRYQSHPEDRYLIHLVPQPDPALTQNSGWTSIDLRQLEIEMRGVEAAHEAIRHCLIIDFDVDADGKIDESTSLILTEQPTVSLPDDWNRYLIDIEAAFRALFPEQPLAGQWRPRFQIDVVPSTVGRASEWGLRRLIATKDARISIALPQGIAPGESRSFHLYFNPTATSSRSGTTIRSQSASMLPITSDALQHAGMTTDLDGSTLTLMPQTDVVGVLVQHWGQSGQLLQSTRLDDETGYRLTLTQVPVQGELLSLTTLLPDGTGNDFVLETESLTNPPRERSATWILHSEGEEVVVDGDLSTDGRHLVIAERYRDDERWFGLVRLLDERGDTLWTWPPSGESLGATFFARFGATGKRLYVAAQQNPISNQNYDDVFILAFDIDEAHRPQLRWRHRVSAGLENDGRSVQQFVPTADGGLVYADWNGNLLRLDEAGEVAWQSGIGSYVRALAPTSDGGALALNFLGVVRIDSGGHGTMIGRRTEGTENQGLWATSEGDLVAIIDSRLRLLGSEVGHPIGRHPRVIEGVRAADGRTFIAVGASDGRTQLFDDTGRQLWVREKRGSMVADIRFLSNGTIAIAHEVFQYDPELLWRFQVLVEVVNFEGELVWTYVGPWSGQPSNSQLRTDRDGSALYVVGSAIMRLALP